MADELNPYEGELITPAEFLNDPYYCGYNPDTGSGIVDTMHLKLQEDFIKMHNPVSGITEAILTGGIGWGKSYILSLGLIWQVFYLSQFKNPQKYFGIAPSAKISIMIISLTEEQSKKNVFFNVKEMLKTMPYFQEKFPYDASKDAKSLLFPKNIELFNGNSSEASAIGLNIYSACIDEANFFRVTRNSKKSKRYGEVYDQAKVLYNSLLRRQESRFLKKNRRPGILYLASSKLFPNDFIEQRITKIRTLENEGSKTNAYILDYNLWKVARERYSADEFQVEVSEVKKRARILKGDETDVDGTIINIPMDFYEKFVADLDSALRDIAGIAIYSTQPYLTQREKITTAMKEDMPKIFSVDEASLSMDERISCFEYITGTIKHPEKPRYVGMDIGLKKDSFGFAMGYIEKMIKIEKEYVDPESGTIKKTYETAPKIVIELVLKIVPAFNVGEVLLSDVRHLIFRLISYGYKITRTSADGFQSVDMAQILKRKGIQHQYISVDRTTIPYDTFKEALYEERIDIVDHPVLREELFSLEKSFESGKVDHPPQGTKDLADAVAQVVYHLTTETPNIPTDMLPSNATNQYDGNDLMDEDEYLKKFEKWNQGCNLIKIDKTENNF
jgi:hypothetical protein